MIITRGLLEGKLVGVRFVSYLSIKRVLDFFLSLSALVLLSPIFLVLAAVSFFQFGPKILFRQVRPGMNEKLFAMYKFRTMTNDRDAQGNLLPDEQRITRWGHFLRSTSLDEIPELLNVLRGDMSLVGPRPLLVSYLPHYNERQRRRHNVRPGITGFAQVNGRNTLTWREKFDLDVQYVDSMSFTLDVQIIGRTVASVFRREGINTTEGGAMPRFDEMDDQS